MVDGFMRVLAFGVFVGFLGILLWHVPRLDLGIVLGVTVGLAAWDFFVARKSG